MQDGVLRYVIVSKGKGKIEVAIELNVSANHLCSWSVDEKLAVADDSVSTSSEEAGYWKCIGNGYTVIVFQGAVYLYDEVDEDNQLTTLFDDHFGEIVAVDCLGQGSDHVVVGS